MDLHTCRCKSAGKNETQPGDRATRPRGRPRNESPKSLDGSRGTQKRPAPELSLQAPAPLEQSPPFRSGLRFDAGFPKVGAASGAILCATLGWVNPAGPGGPELGRSRSFTGNLRRAAARSDTRPRSRRSPRAGRIRLAVPSGRLLRKSSGRCTQPSGFLQAE